MKSTTPFEEVDGGGVCGEELVAKLGAAFVCAQREAASMCVPGSARGWRQITAATINDPATLKISIARARPMP